LLDGEAQKQLALLLREILFDVVRERDDQPNANTRKELSDDGEPSTSGRRLHSTALNLDLYLGRRTKPMLSMLVTNEKFPVVLSHAIEALARIHGRQAAALSAIALRLRRGGTTLFAGAPASLRLT
jgi:hypothetical protein